MPEVPEPLIESAHRNAEDRAAEESSARTPARLWLDMAPPALLPLCFLLTAPVALCVAGSLVLWMGGELVLSSWAPTTLSLTHLFTLGFLTMAMMGTLYQLAGVVGGGAVPGMRLAYLVYALYIASVVVLIWGMATMSTVAFFYAIGSLGIGVLLFTIQIGTALARAKKNNEAVTALWAALVCFFFAASTGLWMAHGYGGMAFPGPRDLWIQVHLSVALLGWIGGLIIAMSWLLLPYLHGVAAPSLPWRRWLRRSTTFGALLPVVLILLQYFDVASLAGRSLREAAAVLTLPAVIAVWGVHPALCAAGLRSGIGEAVGVSFWRAGLLAAPVTAVAAAASFLLPEARWQLLFGWLAIWAWAGMIVHGLLLRLVPFLTNERPPSLEHSGAAPSGAQRRDQEVRARIGFALHLTSIGLGVIAIVTGLDPFVRATGLALFATGAWLLVGLLAACRQGSRGSETGAK
jgi:hypothetical protein